MKSMSPLRRRRIKHAHHAVSGTHQRVGIVLDVIAPVVVGNEAVDFGEITAEQAHQVDHVYALVQQHTASSDRTFGAPAGLIEGDHLGLAVHRPDVDHPTEFSRMQDFQGILHRLVIAVIEAVLEFEARMSPLVSDDLMYLLDSATWRLFAEDMQ